jgi:thymidylate synthase (FAD)
MSDIMDSVVNKTINCLDKGHVTLVDVMPRNVPEGKTADYAIVQAARVSYGDGTKTVNEDRGLIRYLLRHQHTTPLEMVTLKFHCKMPIFVCRQWARHRMSSTNEISGRYSVMKDEFYFPQASDLRSQSQNNKQGGDGTIDEITANYSAGKITNDCNSAYDFYEYMIHAGVSREQARMVLPLNLYTEFYWKIDLHNLFHFLALRADSHAQKEIRVYAEAIIEILRQIVPVALEAWEDYHPMRGAIKLTRLETEALKSYIQKFQSFAHTEFQHVVSDNKREQSEWIEKAKILGINVPPTKQNEA